VDSEILQSDRVMGLPRKSSGELYWVSVKSPSNVSEWKAWREVTGPGNDTDS
jgi:hypothetical protein